MSLKSKKEPKPRREMKRISDKRLAQLGGKAFSTIQPTREPKRDPSSSRSSGTRTPKPARRSGTKRKPRSPEDFARVHGSDERVEFVNGMACASWLISEGEARKCRGPIQNAHTVNGGMGRKSDADTIVPLCAHHHEAYDQHRAPFNVEPHRERMRHYANQVESMWRAARPQGGDSR